MTIKIARSRMNAPADAEAIIEEIRHAFRGVHRGRITLHEAEVIDEYGSDEQRAEARQRDTDDCWERVPDDHIAECTTALCYLDPESWRYYIPAYMIWSLRHLRISNSCIIDATINAFVPSNVDVALDEHSMERYRLLSVEQSKAVCRFLRYMARYDAMSSDYVDPFISMALQKHWAQFCSEDAPAARSDD
jgi:hypothetical protein